MNLSRILANRKLEGRTTYQGLPISIETDKGSIRQGVDSKTGKPWKIKLSWPYGYIRMTEGTDGDKVDCFIGPNPEATHAYVVHINNPHTGAYDEDKCMLGWDSAKEAKAAFLQNYTSRKFFGSMEAMPMDSFKKKIFKTKDNPKRIAAMSKMETTIQLHTKKFQAGGT